MSIETDLEYTPGELRALQTGDLSAYADEQRGHHQMNRRESDGGPQLSEAEERYFESGGDVSEQLRHEYRNAPQDRSDPLERPISLKIQELLDHHIQARQDAEIAHARVDERNRMLIEQLSPSSQHPWQPSQPQPEQRQPWQVRDETSDVIGAVGDLRRLANELLADRREMAEQQAYTNSLNAAQQQDPNFLPAYRALMISRSAELMAARYPQATHDQLINAVMQGQVPADIREKVEQEERGIYRSAFQNGRNPADDIVQMAELRGFQSTRQRAAQAEQQRKQHEAEAAKQRKAEAEEADWRRRIALKMHAGWTIEELLPNREDRTRWYQGSTYYRDHGAR